jgi:hypothetical protein
MTVAAVDVAPAPTRAAVKSMTGITVAINRDNNPDTLLVLLLVAAVPGIWWVALHEWWPGTSPTPTAARGT